MQRCAGTVDHVTNRSIRAAIVALPPDAEEPCWLWAAACWELASIIRPAAIRQAHDARDPELMAGVRMDTTNSTHHHRRWDRFTEVVQLAAGDVPVAVEFLRLSRVEALPNRAGRQSSCAPAANIIFRHLHHRLGFGLAFSSRIETSGAGRYRRGHQRRRNAHAPCRSARRASIR